MTWPHLVRLDTAEHAENVPADTLAKRVVASNIAHLAGSHGQVLVNWAEADGDGLSRSFGGLYSGEHSMWTSDAFPLRMSPSGEPYALRVRLRGRRTTAGDPVTFKIMLANDDTTSARFVTSSTVSSWLTAEASPYDALISPTADQARGLVQNVGAPETLGGPTVSAPETMARIHVACRFSASVVELTGVYVAECFGA